MFNFIIILAQRTDFPFAACTNGQVYYDLNGFYAGPVVPVKVW